MVMLQVGLFVVLPVVVMMVREKQKKVVVAVVLSYAPTIDVSFLRSVLL